MINWLVYRIALLIVLESIPVLAHGALAIDPTTPNTLYASMNTGVFKSTDGGATWTASSQGLGEASVLKLAIDPTTSTTLYAVAGSSGLFKSPDGGAHWALVLPGSSNIPLLSLAIDPQTSTTLYVGTNGNGGLKSTDGGMTWTALTGSFPTNESRVVRVVVIDPLTPTTLYAGTNGGLFKSTDSGMTWLAMNSGLPETLDHRGGQLLQIGPGIGALVIDPLTPTTLYASSRDIFKSTDGAASWAVLKRGEWIENAEVTALVIDPQTPTTLYVALYMSGIFKSTDSGLSWTAVNSGLPLYFEARVEATSMYVTDVVVDPVTPMTLYAQASSNSGEGIFKSVDGGSTWTFSHLGSPRLTHSP
jgi:hypothetical protein